MMIVFFKRYFLKKYIIKTDEFFFKKKRFKLMNLNFRLKIVLNNK